MERVCADFIERTRKCILKKLRAIFSSDGLQIYLPSLRLKRTDKDAYNSKYPNYKKKHQRHEQNK